MPDIGWLIFAAIGGAVLALAGAVIFMYHQLTDMFRWFK